MCLCGDGEGSSFACAVGGAGGKARQGGPERTKESKDTWGERRRRRGMGKRRCCRGRRRRRKRWWWLPLHGWLAVCVCVYVYMHVCVLDIRRNKMCRAYYKKEDLSQTQGRENKLVSFFTSKKEQQLGTVKESRKQGRRRMQRTRQNSENEAKDLKNSENAWLPQALPPPPFPSHTPILPSSSSYTYTHIYIHIPTYKVSLATFFPTHAFSRIFVCGGERRRRGSNN